MNFDRQRLFSLPRVVSVAVILGLAPVCPAAETPAHAAPAPAKPAQQEALDALDRAMARFKTLLARDDDAQHKAAAQAVFDGLKERATAIHHTFDQGRYDELRIDLNLEYQRLASWMAAPVTGPSTSSKSKHAPASLSSSAQSARK